LRPAEIVAVRRAVTRWGRRVDRPLPWRGERDPYRVLVSEVMLQQTQAARVAPAYERFIARFPNAPALAAAEPADVLHEWGSLGYNRRALNLLRAVREVGARGGFPRDVESLRGLPGVGPYTARAVASFAFGVRCAAVDANVRRVVSRVLGDEADVQASADALVPMRRAAAWNQAMIDLGALVCTARRPRCSICPLRRSCPSADRVPARRRRPQPRFETTARYVRGRIVSELRAGPLDEATLRRGVGVTSSRFTAGLASLESDGLVHRAGRVVRLGPPSTA